MSRAAVEAGLASSVVEIQPGRSLAVHHRKGANSSLPRLFFVHGSMASMLQWHALIEHFSSKGHEVIAYDWLGCGLSPKPKSWQAYSFDAHRADLAAILTMYGGNAAYETKNVVICHSAGCSLALGLVGAAAQPSAKVDGMCLLGGLLTVPAQPPIFYLPVFALDWLQPTLSAGFEGLALHQKTRDGATDERRAVLALAKEVNAGNAMHVCKAYYRQLVLPSVDEVRRAGTRANIMLIAGSDDQIVPLSQTQALRTELGAGETPPRETPLHVVPETSHQMMQEEPSMVCTHIDGYLSGLL